MSSKVSANLNITRILAGVGASRLRTAAPRILRQGYERSADIYLAYLRREFDRKSQGGAGWAPLAPSTVKQKGAKTPILVESGRLKASLVRGAPGNVFNATPNGAEVGSDDRLLRIHQFGTNSIPARPVVVKPTPQVTRSMAQPLIEAVRKMLIR